MTEEWKDVKGFEGLYSVSNSGKVFSESFRNNKTVKARRIEMKLNCNGQGYLYVTLSDKGRRKRVYVHRLVAEHFIGDAPDGYVVNHKDRNRANNNVENLEWVTQKENVQYSAEYMKHPKTVYKRSNTGEKYIRYYTNGKRNPCYRVAIRNMNICRQFRTFEEALKFRDEVISGA